MPNPTDTPSFAEFKTTFHPEVHVDEHYQQLYHDHGFEITVEPQDLAMLAYAVNPYGFNDKKDRPIQIDFGSLPKKPTIYGRYNRRKHIIDIHRYSLFSDEDRVHDIDFTSEIQEFYQHVSFFDENDKLEATKRFSTPVTAAAEVDEMNSTLVHEMQHSADQVNNVKSDLSYNSKVLAAILLTGITVQHASRTVMSEGYDLLAETIGDNTTLETIATLGVISLPLVLSLGTQFKLIKNQQIYLRRPGELRARQAEKIIHLLPQPLQIHKID